MSILRELRIGYMGEDPILSLYGDSRANVGYPKMILRNLDGWNGIRARERVYVPNPNGGNYVSPFSTALGMVVTCEFSVLHQKDHIMWEMENTVRELSKKDKLLELKLITTIGEKKIVEVLSDCFFIDTPSTGGRDIEVKYSFVVSSTMTEPVVTEIDLSQIPATIDADLNFSREAIKTYSAVNNGDTTTVADLQALVTQTGENTMFVSWNKGLGIVTIVGKNPDVSYQNSTSFSVVFPSISQVQADLAATVAGITPLITDQTANPWETALWRKVVATGQNEVWLVSKKDAVTVHAASTILNFETSAVIPRTYVMTEASTKVFSDINATYDKVHAYWLANPTWTPVGMTQDFFDVNFKVTTAGSTTVQPRSQNAQSFDIFGSVTGFSDIVEIINPNLNIRTVLSDAKTMHAQTFDMVSTWVKDHPKEIPSDTWLNSLEITTAGYDIDIARSGRNINVRAVSGIDFSIDQTVVWDYPDGFEAALSAAVKTATEQTQAAINLRLTWMWPAYSGLASEQNIILALPTVQPEFPYNQFAAVTIVRESRLAHNRKPPFAAGVANPVAASWFYNNSTGLYVNGTYNLLTP